MPKSETPGAVELLMEDHEKVKGLFKKFEQARGEAAREEIADQVDLELRVHSMIEEEILYPALRDIDAEIVAESFEEHGVVEQLLNELATMDLGEDQFEAKFKVMQENVEHHIEEEERDMFPQCKRIKDYDAIGMQMARRKLELTKEFKSQGEAAERVTSGEPATAKASEKSESVLEGHMPPQPAGGKAQRSRRAAAASSRSRR